VEYSQCHTITSLEVFTGTFNAGTLLYKENFVRNGHAEVPNPQGENQVWLVFFVSVLSSRRGNET